MTKTLFTLLIVLGAMNATLAQGTKTYENQRGETHLSGPIAIEDLKSGTYKTWFDEHYDGFTFEDQAKWKKYLKNTQVEIYLGTWCGDSRYWVPRFLKLWDDLGLDRSQLRLIALYDGQERYKQGPAGEEIGKQIHRVPTFIFMEDGIEQARIVESPGTDLVTDLAQIALGYPSDPNYRAAEYLLKTMEEKTPKDVREEVKKHARAAYRKVKGPGELNTLGYVLLRANRIEEALVVFEVNTYLFPYYANTFDSYAEALAEAGHKEEAIKFYSKVLEMDENNENALKQLEKLKAG